MNQITNYILHNSIGGSIVDGKPFFTFISDVPDCGVVLYDKLTGKEIKKLSFQEEKRIGSVYYLQAEDVDAEQISYCFYKGAELIPDENAVAYANSWNYGEKVDSADLKAVLSGSSYDWENDRFPRILYSDSLIYCMHVRGFTAHKSSQVKAPGTFKGMCEKLSYLKQIGVTAVELQPIYEFLENPVIKRKCSTSHMPLPVVSDDKNDLNYWGYTNGYYYVPKTNYAFDQDAAAEFKNTVKEFHRNQIEVILQFYFPETVDRGQIADILHFWICEYHIDGFHVMGQNIPVDLLVSDPFLSETKLFLHDIADDKNKQYKQLHAAVYNDSYLYDIRRFIKGDEGLMEAALYQLRHIPHTVGRIHFLSNYYGFTLADTFAYDYKHNEANGEDNRDGNDYNCSWNCGEEGNTKSRKILQLRQQMLKNAYAFLLLSQSTPLIFMGDEFGNSQQGNNNPYNQDNEITYLDWSLQKKNKKLFEFWQLLVSFRKAHPILHPADELLLMDTLSLGYPDLSYHGESAWKVQTEGYIRHGGIMLCENYASKEKSSEESFLYIGFNMHWEKHMLAMPKLPKDMRWQPVFSTADTPDSEEGILKPEDNSVEIPARCFVVFCSEKKEIPVKKRKR